LEQSGNIFRIDRLKIDDEMMNSEKISFGPITPILFSPTSTTIDFSIGNHQSSQNIIISPLKPIGENNYNGKKDNSSISRDMRREKMKETVSPTSIIETKANNNSLIPKTIWSSNYHNLNPTTQEINVVKEKFKYLASKIKKSRTNNTIDQAYNTDYEEYQKLKSIIKCN
jgi:hypothetical protein